MVTTQALELVPPPPDGFRASWDLMGNSPTGIPSTEGLQRVPPTWDAQMYFDFRNEERCPTCSLMWPPIGVAEPDEAFTDKVDRYYLEQGGMNLGMGSPYTVPMMALVAPVAPYTETPVHELVLSNSRPADFLAIRETEGGHDC